MSYPDVYIYPDVHIYRYVLATYSCGILLIKRLNLITYFHSKLALMICPTNSGCTSDVFGDFKVSS